MENLKRNKEYSNLKNYINYLEKIGFFKVERKNLPEEIKKKNKKFFVKEYGEKEVEGFISEFIKLKNNDEKIINESVLEEKNEKDKNKYLLKSLSEGIGILELLKHYLDEREKFISNDIFFGEEYGILKRENRKIIKLWKLRYNGTEMIPSKINYSIKIKEIKLSYQCIHDLLVKNWKQKILMNSDLYEKAKKLEKLLQSKAERYYEQIIAEEKFTKINHDSIIQLIVYDFLHYSFSEEEKNSNFEKIKKFLENFDSEIEINEIKRNGKIYEDFKDFLVLNNDLFNEKMKLKEISRFSNFKTKTEILSKKEDFYYYLEKIREIYKGEDYQSVIIICTDYLDLDFVREKTDLETGLAVLGDFNDFTKDYSKEELSRIQCGKKAKNNFTKEEENIISLLSNYYDMPEINLQIRKAIVSIIEQEKIKIKPFRKTLKSLLNDEETRNHPKIIGIMRLLLTRELYKEKNNLSGFEKSNIIQEKVIEILLKINSIKLIEDRLKIKEKFFNDFFEELIKIQKRDIITYINNEHLLQNLEI